MAGCERPFEVLGQRFGDRLKIKSNDRVRFR